MWEALASPEIGSNRNKLQLVTSAVKDVSRQMRQQVEGGKGKES